MTAGSGGGVATHYGLLPELWMEEVAVQVSVSDV
jgi:hypothetical protein